jgi:hypothetical protein
MVDADDIAYFTARAAAERALSEASDNQEAALVHLKLAERYERLAARPAGQRPTLHIVAPRPG